SHANAEIFERLALADRGDRRRGIVDRHSSSFGARRIRSWESTPERRITPSRQFSDPAANPGVGQKAEQREQHENQPVRKDRGPNVTRPTCHDQRFRVISQFSNATNSIVASAAVSAGASSLISKRTPQGRIVVARMLQSGPSTDSASTCGARLNAGQK